MAPRLQRQPPSVSTAASIRENTNALAVFRVESELKGRGATIVGSALAIATYAVHGISDVMPSVGLCRRGAPMLLTGAPFIDGRSA
jgi:hypothetical protein